MASNRYPYFLEYTSLVEIYNVVSPRGTEDYSLPKEFCATCVFIRLGIRTRWRSKILRIAAEGLRIFEEEKKDLGKSSR